MLLSSQLWTRAFLRHRGARMRHRGLFQALYEYGGRTWWRRRERQRQPVKPDDEAHSALRACVYAQIARRHQQPINSALLGRRGEARETDNLRAISLYPSKSSTKWAFVRYRPGPVAGGGGSHRLPHDGHSRAVGVVEKSVSTGTSAITGVAGGRSGSSTSRLPCTSNATGGSWSATAVATSTLASPSQIRRCSGTGRYISRGRAPAAARLRSAVATPARCAMAARACPRPAARNRWHDSLCSRNGERSSSPFT